MVTPLVRFVFPQFKSSSFYFTFLTQVKLNSTNWPAPNVWVFIAQLVEHRTLTQRLWVPIPWSPVFFFRINLHLLKIRWQVSLFKSKSNGYKIELTFKVDERCQTRPWVEKSGRPTPFFHRVLFYSVTHERCQDPGDGLKNLHQKETYAVLLSRPILFSNSPVWFRP